MHISRPDAFLLDTDGTLYHNNRVLPHAIQFLYHIPSHPTIFVTNNSTKVPEEIIKTFKRPEFPDFTALQMLISACVIEKWLEQQISGFHYCAADGNGLHRTLEKYGVKYSEYADFVVIGEGGGLDYNTLVVTCFNRRP